jgi:hypothetical protein
MAFCPMRLREQEGVQYLSLNPFGSYYGRQLDYSHLGGTGIGADLTQAASGALRPNGPSFNGKSLHFSLLLAPYRGDQPPEPLQQDVQGFFYPAGILYHQAPTSLDAVIPNDIRKAIAADERKKQLQSSAPLPAPHAFLANPCDQAADLVWEPPRDQRVTGYEVRWRIGRASEWHHQTIPAGARWRVAGLKNGQRHVFQVRALTQERHSDWTLEAEVVPGPVSGNPLLSMASGLSPWTVVRLVGHSLVHVIRARLGWW